jgi:hypothetical protein
MMSFESINCTCKTIRSTLNRLRRTPEASSINISPAKTIRTEMTVSGVERCQAILFALDVWQLVLYSASTCGGDI